MMVHADRAYLKIINDSQTTFVAMQKEYHELLLRCQMLQTTVSEQGQEIYGDGRRIDELDAFITLGTQRTHELGVQNQNLKKEYDTLLKAEADKMLIAQKLLQEKGFPAQDWTGTVESHVPASLWSA